MSDFKIKLIGVAVAVVFHLLLAATFTHETISEWLKSEPKKEQIDPELPKKAQVAFRFQVPKLEPKLEQPKPAGIPVKKRFNATSSEQPKGKSKQTTHYGDRDTVAQSDTEANQNSVAIPAVKGKKKSADVLASNYQDGKLDNDRAGGAQQLAQNRRESTTEIPDPQQDMSESDKPSPDRLTSIDAGRSLAGSNNPLKDYMDAVRKLPTSVRNKKLTKETPKPNKGEGMDQKQDDLAVKERPKPKSASKPRTKRIDSMYPNLGRDPGFRAQTNSSKISGSISRNGVVASFATEANALGRYKKKVSNITAKEWYRRIGQNPDLVLPGMLQVRWFVYPDGRVKSVQILTSYQGTEIQTGMTLQSITGAKLPTMPKDLVAELDGNPVEMNITFQF